MQRAQDRLFDVHHRQDPRPAPRGADAVRQPAHHRAARRKELRFRLRAAHDRGQEDLREPLRRRGKRRARRDERRRDLRRHRRGVRLRLGARKHHPIPRGPLFRRPDGQADRADARLGVQPPLPRPPGRRHLRGGAPALPSPRGEPDDRPAVVQGAGRADAGRVLFAGGREDRLRRHDEPDRRALSGQRADRVARLRRMRPAAHLQPARRRFGDRGRGHDLARARVRRRIPLRHAADRVVGARARRRVPHRPRAV